jgi:hypothetical protein
MTKSTARRVLDLFAFPLRTHPLPIASITLIFSLFGCTATVVRWDSIRMREEIMAYYNDEIMDNLIRMKQGLPFIHVDVSSVSAAVLSQVSGNVGGGETTTHVNTSPGAVGGLVSIARTLTSPFAYSFTPTHSDNLTMTAVPVIGQLPADNTESGGTAGANGADHALDFGASGASTPEGSPRSTPKPTTTIYAIYDNLGEPLIANGVLIRTQLQPCKDEYVPGTLKRSGMGYYYIKNTVCNKANYTKLCRALFTQTRKASAKQSQTAADVQTIKAQGTTARPQ